MDCQIAFGLHRVAQVVEPEMTLAWETPAGFAAVLALLQVDQIVVVRVAVEKNPLTPAVASETVLRDPMLCF